MGLQRLQIPLSHDVLVPVRLLPSTLLFALLLLYIPLEALGDMSSLFPKFWSQREYILYEESEQLDQSAYMLTHGNLDGYVASPQPAGYFVFRAQRMPRYPYCAITESTATSSNTNTERTTCSEEPELEPDLPQTDDRPADVPQLVEQDDNVPDSREHSQDKTDDVWNLPDPPAAG